MMIQGEDAWDGDVLHGCAAKTTKTWSTICLVEIGMGMAVAGLLCQKCPFWQVLLIFRLYAMPMTCLLGKLSVVQAGNTSTIPYSMLGLAAACYPGGKCDSRESKGDGSRLYYVNPWTMKWSQIIWSSRMAGLSAPGLTHCTVVGGQSSEKRVQKTVKSFSKVPVKNNVLSRVLPMYQGCIIDVKSWTQWCILYVLPMYQGCIMIVLWL
jgi:hypothetical protein